MIRKQSRKIFCRPKRSDSQPNTTLPKKIPSNAELPIHRYERVTDRAERETFGKVRTERQPGDLDVKRVQRNVVERNGAVRGLPPVKILAPFAMRRQHAFRLSSAQPD